MKRVDLLTINEAAKQLSLSRQAIHAAISERRLPVVRVPTTKLMIAPEALDLFKPDRLKQSNGKQRRK